MNIRDGGVIGHGTDTMSTNWFFHVLGTTTLFVFQLAPSILPVSTVVLSGKSFFFQGDPTSLLPFY